MALMLKSKNFVRNALKTSYAKPLLDLMQQGCSRPSRSLTHCLPRTFTNPLNHKCNNSSFKHLTDVTRCSCIRFIQQASANVIEEEGRFNRSRQPFSSRNLDDGNELDKAIFKLDLDVRRTGRLSKIDIENICKKIQDQKRATSTQGLLIIRACGSLLPEEPKSMRIEICDKIWKTLQEIGCPLDVSHYNALLKVYLENEQPFSPIDFLSNMEQKGIEPNRVTYQRLIGGYCQKGDIDGASKILEFMKEKEIAVNEMVFNELIYGHAKANDMNGAKDIIEVMKNSKLDPSSDTYFALARGYALKGDLDAINQCLDEAEKNDVFLTDRDYLNIVRELAISGHSDKVDAIIDRVKKNLGYNQECINVSLELINDSQDEVAFKILLTMPRSTLRDGSLTPAGHFLIRQMVKAGRPADLVLQYCNKLEELKLNDDAITKATEMALRYKKPAHALLFIQAMASKGFPIRNHYFWPILIEKAKEGEQQVYEILKTMCEMGCPPSYDTYLDYVLPKITTSDPNIVIQRIKDLGQTVGTIVNPLVAFYLVNGKASEAVKILEEYPVRLNPSVTTRSLSIGLRGFEDVQPIIKILQHLKDNPEVGSDQALRGDWCGQFLMDYSSNERQFNAANFKSCLNAMLEKNLQISYSALDSLRRLNKITDDIIPILENLASDDIKNIPSQSESSSSPSSSIFNVHPKDMNVEELENHLQELRSKGMNVRGVLRRLLLLHCRLRNVERALQIKQELDQENFVYTAAMHSTLMELFVSANNLKEALQHHKLLEQSDANFKVDDHKIINLCALMVKENMVEEAIELLTKQYEKFSSSEKGDFLVRNVYRLLSAAADKGDIDLTNRLFDLAVIRYGYCKPNNVILGVKIKACLIKEDYDRALKEYEMAASNYKQTPWKNEIFVHLIKIEDTENLQKVVDIANEIHGEVNVLYDLACCFIECDRIKQAKKILETPGLRAYNNRLDKICNNLVEKNKVNDLEQLVIITKDLFDIDRDMMYYNLLKGFIKEENMAKAKGVWTSMQEEDIQPSLKTMKLLAEFLTKNNEPVPFQLPSTSDVTSSSDLAKAIAQKNLENSLEIKNKLKTSGEKINEDDLTHLVELCIQQRNVKEALRITEDMYAENNKLSKTVLRYLILALAREGNINGLESLRPYLQPEMIKIVSFDNILCNAYINKGQAVKFLEKLEKSLDKEAFPSGAILALLDKRPELEDRIVSLADRFLKEENFPIPMNMVWQSYMTKGNFEKADQLMSSYPEIKENLMFNHIRTRIRKESNLVLAEKLVNVVNETNLLSPSKGLAYSTLIDVLVRGDKLDEALKKLEEAKDASSPVEIYRGTLTDLAKALTSKGRDVPFEVPSKESKVNDDSSGSSSDSSDDEKEKKK